MMATKTFKDFGIDIGSFTYGEHKVCCPACEGQRSDPGEKSLNVNVDKGVWNCKRASCGWRGGLNEPDTRTASKASAAEPILAPAAPTRDLCPAAVAFLQSRGISKATADLAGVRSATAFFRDGGDQEALAFVYTVVGEYSGTKYRSVKGKQFTQAKGGCKYAYLHDLAVGRSQVVITEGEFDTLALLECGIQGVVSCPEGAGAVGAKPGSKLDFLETSADVFKPAERIVLAMDNDEAGVHWMEAVAERLGVERCLVVTWPPDCKDANDTLVKHGREVVVKAISDAKMYPCPGLHEAKDYLDAVLARRNAPSVMGVSTGLKNLDPFLRIETGSLHVVTGIPGSGKSEFLDCIAINTAFLHGWRWAVFSPENYPLERHMAKLVEKMAGDGFKYLTEQQIRNAMAWVQEHFVFISEDDRGISVDRLATLLKSASARYGIKGAIVDPWNEIEHMRGRDTNESEYIGSALTLLRNIARRQNFALFIAAHPTKLEKNNATEEYAVPTPYDISGSANWRNKADVCLAVYRLTKNPTPVVEIHIQKMRFREVGKMGKAVVYWQSDSGSYRDQQTPQRADNDEAVRKWA